MKAAIPYMLTYIKYFMKHIKDLLIDHCNPVMRAHYFGVIFDEIASYDEIKNGTANISQIPGVNELFKLAHDDKVSLVHLCDSSWLRIEPSIIIMYEKLVQLGFVYYNGEISIVESEETQKHV